MLTRTLFTRPTPGALLPEDGQRDLVKVDIVDGRIVAARLYHVTHHGFIPGGVRVAEAWSSSTEVPEGPR